MLTFLALGLNGIALVIFVAALFGPLTQSDNPPEISSFLLFGGIPIGLLLLAARFYPGDLLGTVFVGQAFLLAVVTYMLW